MAVTANTRGAAKGQRQWNRAVLAAEKRDVLACRSVSLLSRDDEDDGLSPHTVWGGGKHTLVMPSVPVGL